MSVLPIRDCSIKIKPTATLIDFVRNKLDLPKDAPENILRIKKKSMKNDFVLFIKDIKWLKEQLTEYRETTGEQVYLHELLEKSRVSLPEPELLPRNPELDARVKKLIQQEKTREYLAMTKDVDSFRKYYPEDTIAYQMKQINRQLIAVAQFVFSVITGFVFGFLGIELIVGHLDFGFRLLLGIMFALIVALAEIYFLAKKLNEEYTVEVTEKPIRTKVHQD